MVKVEKLEGGKIYVITLNRPHRMNSIGDGLGQALFDAYLEFRDDPNARVSILTGAGDRAFCAGADLIATSEGRQADAKAEDKGGRPMRQAPAGLQRNSVPLAEGMGLWKPTIAAINGFAIAGGFMFAMQCDIRIRSEERRVGKECRL